MSLAAILGLCLESDKGNRGRAVLAEPNCPPICSGASPGIRTFVRRCGRRGGGGGATRPTRCQQFITITGVTLSAGGGAGPGAHGTLVAIMTQCRVAVRVSAYARANVVPVRRGRALLGRGIARSRYSAAPAQPRGDPASDDPLARNLDGPARHCPVDVLHQQGMIVLQAAVANHRSAPAAHALARPLPLRSRWPASAGKRCRRWPAPAASGPAGARVPAAGCQFLPSPATAAGVYRPRRPAATLLRRVERPRLRTRDKVLDPCGEPSFTVADLPERRDVIAGSGAGSLRGVMVRSRSVTGERNVIWHQELPSTCI